MTGSVFSAHPQIQVTVSREQWGAKHRQTQFDVKKEVGGTDGRTDLLSWCGETAGDLLFAFVSCNNIVTAVGKSDKASTLFLCL
jgi:hypothetical protein